MPEILEQIQTELKGFIAKQGDEVKALGSVTTETKNAITELVKRLDAIEVKMAKPVDPVEARGSLAEALKSNRDLEHLIAPPRGRRGAARIELKGAAAAAILQSKTLSRAGVGFPTYGVMPAEREAGMTWKVRPQLRMLDVIPSRPTVLGEIFWLKESNRPTKASPITEYTGLKPLVEPTFTTDKETVETIAVLMKASNQLLADMSEMEGFLRFEGADRVSEELDLQILSGSGTSPNLNGITTQAQAWDVTLLSASDGYEYSDMIGGACKQIAADDEVQSDPFAVMHPQDAWSIRLLKDTTGRYLFGDPNGSAGPLTLFGVPIVETTQLTQGYFVVGSGSPQCIEYRNRQDLTIDISTEDGDNFKYNLVTIRFELRGALIVKRPDAFVYGSLSKSPA